jgi:hypothetical protein
MSSGECVIVGNVLEVCLNDVVEVVVEGGYRYHGVVAKLGKSAILLHSPPIGVGGGYVLVALEGIRALRVISCGSKKSREVCIKG